MRRMRRILAVMLAIATVASGMPAAQVHAGETRTEQKAGTDITGLTVNYQTNPLGIEAEGIRFAWQMDSTAVGAKQAAYQKRGMRSGTAVKWRAINPRGLPAGEPSLRGTGTAGN